LKLKIELFGRPGRERLLDSVQRVPEKTETKTKEESLDTPIKYNQEAALNFVKFCERRRGGILAYL